MPNVMVTGPSSGIGREVALAMARLEFHVIAAGRSPEKVGRVVDEIVSGGGSAEHLALDLASLESARDAARAFEDSGRQLDVLINNAGVGVTRGVTSDGFQLQFGINHLGHFMLFHGLRRTFAPGARIVQVSSEIYHRARGIDFEMVTRRTRGMGVQAYAQSKLANILFVRELARQQPGWRAYAVHPGMVDTGMWPWWTKPFTRGKLTSVEEGADTIVWCASGPEETSGGYFANRKQRTLTGLALDDDLARDLWTRSERWCGVGPVN